MFKFAYEMNILNIHSWKNALKSNVYKFLQCGALAAFFYAFCHFTSTANNI